MVVTTTKRPSSIAAIAVTFNAIVVCHERRIDKTFLMRPTVTTTVMMAAAAALEEQRSLLAANSKYKNEQETDAADALLAFTYV